MLNVSCNSTDATDRYQIQRSWKPDIRARKKAGIANVVMRAAETTRDGTVFPIAWNMLEATKITPDGTKLHDAMRRYSSPTAITDGSFEKNPTIAAGAI